MARVNVVHKTDMLQPFHSLGHRFLWLNVWVKPTNLLKSAYSVLLINADGHKGCLQLFRHPAAKRSTNVVI